MTGWGNGAKLAATRHSRPAMQQIIGGQSDVGKLRRVAVKHARDAFGDAAAVDRQDRKSTRLNSSHTVISYAVFCLKKKKKTNNKSNIINKEQQTQQEQ